MSKTISTVSELHAYSDFYAPREVEVCEYGGVGYVAVRVCPRGFANEFTVFVSRADDADGVAVLMRKIERRYRSEVGDDYDAQWLSRKQLAQHIHSGKDASGWSYLIDASGDSLRV